MLRTLSAHQQGKHVGMECFKYIIEKLWQLAHLLNNIKNRILMHRMENIKNEQWNRFIMER
jgi:hypothetical protein